MFPHFLIRWLKSCFNCLNEASLLRTFWLAFWYSARFNWQFVTPADWSDIFRIFLLAEFLVLFYWLNKTLVDWFDIIRILWLAIIYDCSLADLRWFVPQLLIGWWYPHYSAIFDWLSYIMSTGRKSTSGSKRQQGNTSYQKDLFKSKTNRLKEVSFLIIVCYFSANLAHCFLFTEQGNRGKW